MNDFWISFLSVAWWILHQRVCCILGLMVELLNLGLGLIIFLLVLVRIRCTQSLSSGSYLICTLIISRYCWRVVDGGVR